jgi:hypothetical protein
MDRPAQLPHLFGRFTTVLRGHADLHGTLRQLRTMCGALEDPSPAPAPELAPPRLLGRLRDELTAHFAAEEAASHYGAIVAEEPGLSAPVAELCHEHAIMLRALDALCSMAQDEPFWPHLPRPTRELLQRLEAHERAEAVLLRTLFHPDD